MTSDLMCMCEYAIDPRPHDLMYALCSEFFAKRKCVIISLYWQVYSLQYRLHIGMYFRLLGSYFRQLGCYIIASTGLTSSYSMLWIRITPAKSSRLVGKLVLQKLKNRDSLELQHFFQQCLLAIQGMAN